MKEQSMPKAHFKSTQIMAVFRFWELDTAPTAAHRLLALSFRKNRSPKGVLCIRRIELFKYYGKRGGAWKFNFPCRICQAGSGTPMGTRRICAGYIRRD